MCAARRRPSLPAQTSPPHATASAAFPPRFPIGEYTGVHSVPTFSRRPFPAPPGLRFPPRFTLPQLVPPPFAFPSFPQFRASAGTSPLFSPAPRPHRDSHPCVSPSCNSPKNLRPRDSPPVSALPRRAFPFSSRSFLHAPGKADCITSLRLRVRVPSRPQTVDFRRLYLTFPSKNHCFFTPLRPFLSTIEF